MINKYFIHYFQMYSEGSSVVKQDNTTAFDYFKKAADKVHSCLFYHLLSTYCLTDVCSSILVRQRHTNFYRNPCSNFFGRHVFCSLWASSCESIFLLSKFPAYFVFGWIVYCFLRHWLLIFAMTLTFSLMSFSNSVFFRMHFKTIFSKL